MPQYQWLFFDADGTLFDYDRAEVAALEQAFEHIGIGGHAGDVRAEVVVLPLGSRP